MTDNGMKTLRCGIEDHGDMDRLFEDHRPLTAAFSLWICQGCGAMAVHLEVPGDIYWYNAQSKTRTTDEPGAPRVSLMEPVFGWPPSSHRAGCAYCPERFDCSCDNPGQRHMCPRCDDAAEESKMAGEFPTGDLGERADEARQVQAYEASLEQQDDGEGERMRQQEEADDRHAATLDGDTLPW